MIIVSNTGPLIGLAKINQIGLLRHLAAAVYIPPQVHRELLAKSGPEATAIDEALNRLLKNSFLIEKYANIPMNLRVNFQIHGFFIILLMNSFG